MLCSKCGYQNAGKAKFCGVCGSKLSQESSSAPKYSPPPPKAVPSVPKYITPESMSSQPPQKSMPSYSQAASPPPQKSTPSYSQTASPPPQKSMPSYSQAATPPQKSMPSYSQAASPPPQKSVPHKQKNIRSSTPVNSGTMRTGNFQINYAGKSENQDNLLIMPAGNSRACLFIVADGKGFASSMALKTIGSHTGNANSPDAGVMAKAIRKANEEIYRYAQNEGESSYCTVTAVLLQENRLTVAHAGDSRAYIINKNKIRQITKDHIIMERSVQNSHFTQNEEETSPGRKPVYRMVGTNPHIEVALYEERIAQRDTVLMCNYGLWMYISEEELHKMASGSVNMNSLAEKLITLANQKGCEDDITVIIFQAV